MQNNYRDQIEDILKRPLNRAEFIRDIGLALLGMIGVTSLIMNLAQPSHKRSRSVASLTKGYGGGAYGR